MIYRGERPEIDQARKWLGVENLHADCGSFLDSAPVNERFSRETYEHFFATDEEAENLSFPIEIAADFIAHGNSPAMLTTTIEWRGKEPRLYTDIKMMDETKVAVVQDNNGEHHLTAIDSKGVETQLDLERKEANSLFLSLCMSKEKQRKLEELRALDLDDSLYEISITDPYMVSLLETSLQAKSLVAKYVKSASALVEDDNIRITAATFEEGDTIHHKIVLTGQDSDATEVRITYDSQTNTLYRAEIDRAGIWTDTLLEGEEREGAIDYIAATLRSNSKIWSSNHASVRDIVG